MRPYNKTTWYPDEFFFIKKNFSYLSAYQMLEHINKYRSKQIKISTLRAKCREMGLLKNEKPEEWNQREINFLLHNYQKLGNVDICDKLNKYANRSRFFNVKSIWKKMQLLNIHLSEKQLKRIKTINVDKGYWIKSQTIVAAKRRYPEGKRVLRIDKKTRRKYYWIKHEDKMVQYHRFVWIQNFGPIPKGHKIYFSDGNSLNCKPNNLLCLSPRGMRYKKESVSEADPFLLKETVKHSTYFPSVTLPGF